MDIIVEPMPSVGFGIGVEDNSVYLTTRCCGTWHANPKPEGELVSTYCLGCKVKILLDFYGKDIRYCSTSFPIFGDGSREVRVRDWLQCWFDSEVEIKICG